MPEGQDEDDERDASTPRPRPPSPASLDLSKRWPKATFEEVEDLALREACLVAQQIALVVLEQFGPKRLSVRKLAREAGVQRDQVNGLIDGTAWVSVYTTVRVLRAVDLTLPVPQPREPESSPETGPALDPD